MVMVITSPPYADSIHVGQGGTGDTGRIDRRVDWRNKDTSYGTTPGQIGALKEGNMTLTYTDIKVPTEDWYGCYDGGWQAGHLTDDSFSHPAKMAKGLVYKIVREGLARGWWTKEDTILDPFGGIGSTGIACSAYGIASISIELEPRFCRMAAGYDCPGVTKAEWVRWYARKQQARNTRFCPTCLDGLKYKKNSGIIPTSEAHRYVGNFELHTKAWAVMGYPQPVILQGDSRFLLDVIQQAGGVVTSPPWYDVGNHKEAPEWHQKRPSIGPNNSISKSMTYGTTPGQIGAMPAGAILSPPWERQLASHDNFTPPNDTQRSLNYNYDTAYGDSPNQIGNTTGNDYESACRLVYSQLFQIMTPGGVMACVVKPFVKKGELVDLPGMTLGWLTDIGFEAVLWINAKVVAPAEQLDMFSELNDVKERKSFFRKLHETRCVHRSTKAKDGAYQCQLQKIACNFYKAAKVKPQWAPKDCNLYLNNKMLGLGIDAEVVLIVRKPGAGGGTSVVTSPPYEGSVERWGAGQGKLNEEKRSFAHYGNTPGQIGKLALG